MVYKTFLTISTINYLRHHITRLDQSTHNIPIHISLQIYYYFITFLGRLGNN